MANQEENKITVDLESLEHPEKALNNLEEKECLTVAMSSYYLLYR